MKDIMYYKITVILMILVVLAFVAVMYQEASNDYSETPLQPLQQQLDAINSKLDTYERRLFIEDHNRAYRRIDSLLNR